MIQPRTARRPRATWFAVALAVLLAEVFAFAHPLDADTHGVGEPCKICLGLGSLSAANVASLPSLDMFGHSPHPGVEAPRPWVSVDRILQRARDPPQLS
jgi:hypothetical protein